MQPESPASGRYPQLGGDGHAGVTLDDDSHAGVTLAGKGRGAKGGYVGRRRLMSSAARAANANTSAPSRTQPTLASPLIVS